MRPPFWADYGIIVLCLLVTAAAFLFSHVMFRVRERLNPRDSADLELRQIALACGCFLHGIGAMLGTFTFSRILFVWHTQPWVLRRFALVQLVVFAITAGVSGWLCVAFLRPAVRDLNRHVTRH